MHWAQFNDFSIDFGMELIQFWTPIRIDWQRFDFDSPVKLKYDFVRLFKED